MTQDQLWAPWRLPYIVSTKETQPAGCFLCRYTAGPESEDRTNHVVCRTPLSIATLNRFPYNNGHLLVAPRAHKGALGELTNEELLDGMQLLQRFTAVMQDVLNPDGFNIGLNLGRVAGAGLPGHLHWHIVPRWNGDTNFMTVLGDVNVIPQSLEALHELLVKALE